MLRPLSSGRRRPRYGTHICAAFAAVLLLFSVAVLHSRLGTDRRPRPFASSTSDLTFPDDADDSAADIVTDPLLADDADPSTAGEDRIDELDIVEEEARVSDEESEESIDDPGGSTASRSVYFWDHVVGVKRRSFENRVIDPWEDYSAFDLSSSSSSNSDQGAAAAAFGSDDEPVDEEVRRKLGSIRSVEDALLLKTTAPAAKGAKGAVAAAMREGWGEWFDKKGDFLRRDRMFKSNLELLNPMNNMLLQDPDSVGLTLLTRGDKLMQKAMLDELRKMPFSVKNQFGVVDGGNGGEGSMRGRRNEVKGSERRPLDDNGGGGKESKDVVSGFDSSNFSGMVRNVENGGFDNGSVKEERLSYEGRRAAALRVNNVMDAEKVDNLLRNGFVRRSRVRGKVGEVRLETSGPVYADGKRWGYFPGLRPHLPFSRFMEEFFMAGKCEMKVFMVWNSPPWMFGVRYQRGLESLLYHHPDACVVVFTETLELDFFKDFVKDGYKVSVAMPNLDELLKNTPTHAFASLWFEWRKTKFYPTHYSELVRLAVLHMYGGMYLDFDVIVMKPLLSLHNSVGLENLLDNSSLNGAVMTFEKNSPFILECLKEFYATYDDTQLRWNGADLLTRVVGKLLNGEKNSENQIGIKLQPSYMFFPINRQNITRYFAAPTDDTEKALQESLFRKILDESFTFHFWNSVTSTLVPEPGSLVVELLNHHCVRCLDTL